MIKRVALFLLTNIAVMIVIGIVVRILGVGNFASSEGLDLSSLFVFSMVVGFTGSIISLLMSKSMAKMSVGARVITHPANAGEQWLLETVAKLAKNVHITMPEVAIFDDQSPNAFATGAFKNSALVAVSTGLLTTMETNEIEAVLAHEIGHVANGDMVTLTLIQGVVNTFVVFFARIIGYFVDRVLLKNNDEAPGIGYMIASFVAEICLGILASLIVMAFSRYREFKADAAGASLAGRENMIAALQALQRSSQPTHLPESVKAFGINGKGMSALFSTHPSLEDRINALRQG
jgi:heat shock protein HtpX